MSTTDSKGNSTFKMTSWYRDNSKRLTPEKGPHWLAYALSNGNNSAYEAYFMATDGTPNDFETLEKPSFRIISQ